MENLKYAQSNLQALQAGLSNEIFFYFANDYHYYFLLDELISIFNVLLLQTISITSSLV